MAAITSETPLAFTQVNRRRQGSLGGLLVTAMGAGLLASAVVGEARTASVFLALSAAFAIAYQQGRQPYVYLVGMCIFAALGAGMLVASVAPPESGAAAFLATAALGPVAVFLIRPTRRWPLGISALLGAMGAAEALGITVLPLAVQPLLVPGTLILVGVYLIVGPRRT
jgi:hypothetical protein